MATQLIETLTGRGRRVAVIAGSAGPLAIDTPGKDSYEHAAAGAYDVVVVSGRRWARVHRNDPPAPPRLAALAGLAEDADVVLRWDSMSRPRLGSRSNAAPQARPARGFGCWRKMAANRRFTLTTRRRSPI